MLSIVVRFIAPYQSINNINHILASPAPPYVVDTRSHKVVLIPRAFRFYKSYQNDDGPKRRNEVHQVHAVRHELYVCGEYICFL